MEQEPQVNFDVSIPEELEEGVYANLLNVWHTAHEFTLDFATALPVQVQDMPLGEIRIPAKVTTRVKIPPTIMFEVIRALNENLTKYEQSFGPIHRPAEETLYYPGDLDGGDLDSRDPDNRDPNNDFPDHDNPDNPGFGNTDPGPGPM